MLQINGFIGGMCHRIIGGPHTAETEFNLSIFNAIVELRDTTITSQQDAESFLRRFPLESQKVIVAAVYLGRTHFRYEEIRDDVDMSTGMISSLNPEEYAKALFSVRNQIELYLNELLHCAQNSNFDLNNIKVI